MATEKIQELADEYGIPTEVVEEYIEYMGFDADEVDSLNYYGTFKNESDFAEQLVDEGVITDLGRYLYMTATDMRILAGEEADNRVDNMDDEEVLDETGDNYSPDEVDEAREYLKSEYYDEIHEELEKDAVGYFVDQFGYREEDLAKQSIFSVDYDKLGESLEYDFTYITHDGDVYVFNNYANGGEVEDDEEEDEHEYARGGGIPKSYTHFIVRKSDNKIINGYDYKGVDADDIKYYTKEDFKDMEISSKDFTLLTKQSLMSKGINPYDESNWTNQYAEGGITEHGLRVYDRILKSGKIRSNDIVVENDWLGQKAIIDLDKGKRKVIDRYNDGGVMAKGGEVRYKVAGNNFSQEIENGQKMRALLSKVYENQSGENRYPENFIKEIALTGKIVKVDGSYFLKDYTYNGTITKFEFLDDKDFLGALKYTNRPAIKTFKFEKGGVTFDDKVKAISNSLMERKKVSPSVQKDYGKTYSRKEAVESAKRIAGAMRKKETSKKK